MQTLAAAVFSFLAVLRRGWLKHDPDILIEVRGLWWTRCEQLERDEAVLREIWRRKNVDY